jgi:hypothetical protein
MGTSMKFLDRKNLVDMSVARGVKISFSASQIDIKADNGTVPLKGQMDVKAKVEFALLERLARKLIFYILMECRR